jgi:hypothetical protein
MIGIVGLAPTPARAGKLLDCLVGIGMADGVRAVEKRLIESQRPAADRLALAQQRGVAPELGGGVRPLDLVQIYLRSVSELEWKIGSDLLQRFRDAELTAVWAAAPRAFVGSAREVRIPLSVFDHREPEVAILFHLAHALSYPRRIEWRDTLDGDAFIEMNLQRVLDLELAACRAEIQIARQLRPTQIIDPESYMTPFAQVVFQHRFRFFGRSGAERAALQMFNDQEFPRAVEAHLAEAWKRRQAARRDQTGSTSRSVSNN